MKELTPLEALSDREEAASSEAIEQLFDTLRNTEVEKNAVDEAGLLACDAISTEDLREDTVVEASDAEKQLIIDNFPKKKNNCLIVPKVIEE